MSANDKRPVVLVFAGHDPSGGAGLQADIETLNALGCQPITVITALTIQDSSHVYSFEALAPAIVVEQATTVLREFTVSAIKTGMLGSSENIQSIAELLQAYPSVPLVVDPVLASNQGDSLSKQEVVKDYRESLLPIATLCSPNSIEAARLSDGESKPQRQAESIGSTGCEYTLITGAHEAGDKVVNRLFSGQELIQELIWPRLEGEYHGSGCTLASAIAGNLALGKPVVDAVSRAQSYTFYSLSRANNVLEGQRIPVRL